MRSLDWKEPDESNVISVQLHKRLNLFVVVHITCLYNVLVARCFHRLKYNDANCGVSLDSSTCFKTRLSLFNLIP